MFVDVGIIVVSASSASSLDGLVVSMVVSWDNIRVILCQWVGSWIDPFLPSAWHSLI